MEILVDGNVVASQILSKLKDKALKLKERGIVPRLIVILVGRDPASLNYVKAKQKKAAELGIKVEIRNFAGNVSSRELAQEIKKINSDQRTSGIIIQLPLPPALDKQKILDLVSPELDVDCLTSENKKKLIAGKDMKFVSPAAAAVMEILRYYKVDLANSNILIVGSGELIGKPLAAILLHQKINFKLANRYTENLSGLTREADIIITGVGKPNLITGGMIKEGTVVIDAGTTGSEEGEIVGDVDTASVSKKAGLLAAVPGGVGPVTVAMLFKNVVDQAVDRLWQRLPGG